MRTALLAGPGTFIGQINREFSFLHQKSRSQIENDTRTLNFPLSCRTHATPFTITSHLEILTLTHNSLCGSAVLSKRRTQTPDLVQRTHATTFDY